MDFKCRAFRLLRNIMYGYGVGAKSRYMQTSNLGIREEKKIEMFKFINHYSVH